MLRYEFGYSSDSINQMTRWELDIELAFINAAIEKENLKHSLNN